jgi:hypothetical protein
MDSDSEAEDSESQSPTPQAPSTGSTSPPGTGRTASSGSGTVTSTGGAAAVCEAESAAAAASRLGKQDRQEQVDAVAAAAAAAVAEFSEPAAAAAVAAAAVPAEATAAAAAAAASAAAARKRGGDSASSTAASERSLRLRVWAAQRRAALRSAADHLEPRAPGLPTAAPRGPDTDSPFALVDCGPPRTHPDAHAAVCGAASAVGRGTGHPPRLPPAVSESLRLSRSAVTRPAQAASEAPGPTAVLTAEFAGGCGRLHWAGGAGGPVRVGQDSDCEEWPPTDSDEAAEAAWLPEGQTPFHAGDGGGGGGGDGDVAPHDGLWATL